MDRFFDRLYGVLLWQRDRPLGLLVLLFVIGQSYFTYKGVETFPFFHYGMYAAPAAPDRRYTVTHIRAGHRADGAIIPLAQLGAPTFWEYQLVYYSQLRQQFPSNPSLRNTIQHRFYSYPTLEKLAYQQLCNDSTALTQLEAQLKVCLRSRSFSIWKENFDWVNKKIVLVKQQQLYTCP